MARKIVLVRDDDSGTTLLTEVAAADEAQLQERMKNDPDLLPIDEFGMAGPLLVVGRETTLPSGAVDLVVLTRSGELLIVEFKTGPQNPDFRAALAQLVDYGSDLWRRDFSEFEANVPIRYFAGSYCTDPRVKSKTSLADAARVVWTDLTDEEWTTITDRVTEQLASGGFHYVVVAQRFTPTIQRTIEYLNATMPAARFYAVELVRFAAAGISAFESRTVLRPGSGPSRPTPAQPTGELAFLASLADDSYRGALEHFFEFCRGQRLRFEWGSKGTSIRLPTIDRPEPLTVAWVFPSGNQGWMGLGDVNLGFDPTASAKTPSVAEALHEYLDQIGRIAGAEPVRTQSLRAFHLAPSSFVHSAQQVQEALAALVQRASAGE